jgi:hypothetical protein
MKIQKRYWAVKGKEKALGVRRTLRGKEIKISLFWKMGRSKEEI